MKTGLGHKGLGLSYQQIWPGETECSWCTSERIDETIYARFAYAFMETKEAKYLSGLKEKKDKIWPHDAVAIAIYICPECGEPVAKWNQA